MRPAGKKRKVLPSWDTDAGNFFDDKAPSPGIRITLMCCDMLLVFFESLKECTTVIVLTRQKTVMKTMLIRNNFSELFESLSPGLWSSVWLE